MLIIDHNHLCFFAGVLQDEMYHQNEFYGSLIQQTENHRGGDDLGSAAKMKIIGGVMISAVLPKSYPLHKMLII